MAFSLSNETDHVLARMRQTGSILGVVEDGDGLTSWHVVGVGPTDHVTLCGMDGNDPAVEQFGTVPAAPGQKINCAQCKQIWEGVKALPIRRADFID